MVTGWRGGARALVAAHVAELKGDVEEGDVAVEGLEQEPLDDERVVVRLLFTPGAVKRRC